MNKLACFVFGFSCAAVMALAIPVTAQPREVSAVQGVVSVVVDRVNIGSNTLLFNDTTFVPLRQISEMLGAYVSYDALTRTATITTAEHSLAYFEHFPDIPTFESVTGVSNISIFEHDAARLRFSVSKSYSSDYEFFRYLAALTSAGFVDEFGQDIGGNGTIVLTGGNTQIVVSMLGQSYTFSIART
ncbi:MAG: copper amine oxidase N-terminal domain-containing protein [Defluviitaleaceae bacterium]|nr:copper amine oxidase N-terminal domain-containing protein [Defluviitaleaceae bacterium]